MYLLLRLKFLMGYVYLKYRGAIMLKKIDVFKENEFDLKRFKRLIS
ncbi:MAG: hypothetical protein R2861_09475 [Desulfobacterales bacterium]